MAVVGRSRSPKRSGPDSFAVPALVPLKGTPAIAYRLTVMTVGGKRADGPRWGRLLGILLAIAFVVGGVVACQAIRAASPEYQCKQGNGVWVEGYGVETPYCSHLTPKQPRH